MRRSLRSAFPRIIGLSAALVTAPLALQAAPTPRAAPMPAAPPEPPAAARTAQPYPFVFPLALPAPPSAPVAAPQSARVAAPLAVPTPFRRPPFHGVYSGTLGSRHIVARFGVAPWFEAYGETGYGFGTYYYQSLAATIPFRWRLTSASTLRIEELRRLDWTPTGTTWTLTKKPILSSAPGSEPRSNRAACRSSCTGSSRARRPSRKTRPSQTPRSTGP